MPLGRLVAMARRQVNDDQEPTRAYKAEFAASTGPADTGKAPARTRLAAC